MYQPAARVGVLPLRAASDADDIASRDPRDQHALANLDRRCSLRNRDPVQPLLLLTRHPSMRFAEEILEADAAVAGLQQRRTGYCNCTRRQLKLRMMGCGVGDGSCYVANSRRRFVFLGGRCSRRGGTWHLRHRNRLCGVRSVRESVVIGILLRDGRDNILANLRVQTNFET